MTRGRTRTGLIISVALSVPDKRRADKRTGLRTILWWDIKSHGGPSVIINPPRANFCFVFCCVNSRVLLLLTVLIKPTAFTASQRRQPTLEHWDVKGVFEGWFSGVLERSMVLLALTNSPRKIVLNCCCVMLWLWMFYADLAPLVVKLRIHCALTFWIAFGHFLN